MKAKVLLIDIETRPLEVYAWGLFDQNIPLNMIKSDWHVLSWSAKWEHDPDTKIMYMDLSKDLTKRGERKMLLGIHSLLNEADIVVGHNSARFDTKKLNARFAIHDIKPTNTYRQIDTLKIAKKYFSFTSNKLEYLAEALGAKYKKLKQRKYAGFEMWKECLNKNKEAWGEMEAYNKRDVLALQNVYHKLVPWDSSINFNVYTDDDAPTACSCGNKQLHGNGFYHSNTGKFARYRCRKCGASFTSKINLFSPEKKKNLREGKF